jgi:hypothetical protein
MKLYMPTTLNPVFQMSRPPQPTLQRLANCKREAVSIRVRPDALYERSSLWNMYVTNPPCQSARIKLPVEPKDGSRIKSDGGLTVGDILAAAARYEDENCFGRERYCPRRNERRVFPASLNALDGVLTSSTRRVESVYDVDFVTLCVDLPREDKIQPVLPSEAERATMVFNLR